SPVVVMLARKESPAPSFTEIWNAAWLVAGAASSAVAATSAAVKNFERNMVGVLQGNGAERVAGTARVTIIRAERTGTSGRPRSERPIQTQPPGQCSPSPWPSRSGTEMTDLGSLAPAVTRGTEPSVPRVARPGSVRLLRACGV